MKNEKHVLDESLDGKELKHASKGKRFANYLVDIFAIYLLFGVFFALAMLTGVVQFDHGNFNSAGVIIQMSAYPIMLFYYAVFEASTGKTLGKYLTKTKAVTVDGNKITFKNALGRSLCRFIPFEAFSFFGKPGKGWHDSISKTKVVEDH